MVLSICILTLVVGVHTSINIGGTTAAPLQDSNLGTTMNALIASGLVSNSKNSDGQRGYPRGGAMLLQNNTTNIVGSGMKESEPLDLRPNYSSTWGSKSTLQARWGRHRLRFKVSENSADRGCYDLVGRASRQADPSKIRKCGRLKERIHKPEHRLGAERTFHTPISGQGGPGQGQANVKATKTRSKRAGEIVVHDKGDRVPDVTVEVALFADAQYMNHLYELGYDTTLKAHNWFVNKWNTIQGVYKNIEKIGVRVRFKLVKMELWWYNPAGYPPASANETTRLDWFCRNTPQGDGADQKILYTFNTGTRRYESWSKVGKTCVPKQNCYLIKSPTLEVSTELHEMGHSFGLLHDDQMEGCTPPQGFMGPMSNYLFKLCYRGALFKRLRHLDCLYRDDFMETETIPDLPFWMEFV